MITGSMIGFYLLAFVAIIASLRVITRANPVHALLNMIVSLLAVAGVFFAIGAPFAGALEIIVYAGAIMVLFVFVVMMLNLGAQNMALEESWLTSSAWAVPVGLAFIIGLVVATMIGMDYGHRGEVVAVAHGSPLTAAWIGVETVSAKMIGGKLFTEYLLLVEIAGFLLLAGLVAAYHLARRSLDDENDSHNSLVIDKNSGETAPLAVEQQTGKLVKVRQVQEEKA